LNETAPHLPPHTGPDGALKRVFGEYKFFWVAFFVILLDQIVKLLVKFTMHPYEEIKVIGSVVRINFIENKGAAFGLTIADLLSKVGVPMQEESAKLALTLFSIFAVVVIIYLLQQVRHSNSALPYFLALILGGAVGNILDRVFYGVWFAGINDYEGGLLHGRVVDMFYINLVHGKFWGMDLDLLPVFNIADASIGIGIFAILFFQRQFLKFGKANEEPPAQPEVAAVMESEPPTPPAAPSA
jgi:signal peptidase II